MGYIDWSITVPLQMIEFNLILKAAKAPIGPAGFWKLLIGTVCMLAFGYAGETEQLIHGLASLWVCAAGVSSSLRSLLGNLLRRLAPTTYQKPSNSPSTTCVSL